MGADIHCGFQRPPKVVKGDTEIVGIGMEFVKTHAGESPKAFNGVFDV